MTQTPRAPGAALRTVLLDVDGTLIDSNDGHARAWASLLSMSVPSMSSRTVRSADPGARGVWAMPSLGQDRCPRGGEVSAWGRAV